MKIKSKKNIKQKSKIFTRKIMKAGSTKVSEENINDECKEDTIKIVFGHGVVTIDPINTFIIPDGVNLVFFTELGRKFLYSTETDRIIKDYLKSEEINYDFRKVFKLEDDYKGKIYKSSDNDSQFLTEGFTRILKKCDDILIKQMREIEDKLNRYTGKDFSKLESIQYYETIAQNKTTISLRCGDNNLKSIDLLIDFNEKVGIDQRLRGLIYGLTCKEKENNLNNKKCYLSELVKYAGKGTYFINVCRGIEGNKTFEQLNELEQDVVEDIEMLHNFTYPKYETECFLCDKNAVHSCHKCDYRYCEDHIRILSFQEKFLPEISGHDCIYQCDMRKCSQPKQFNCTKCIFCGKRICLSCFLSNKHVDISNYRSGNHSTDMCLKINNIPKEISSLMFLLLEQLSTKVLNIELLPEIEKQKIYFEYDSICIIFEEYKEEKKKLFQKRKKKKKFKAQINNLLIKLINL